MPRKYWFETYGCQMNKAESNALALILDGHGWKEAKHPEESQLVIINTCSVRKTAENRIWGRLGYYKKQKQKLGTKIAVVGCMAERLKENIQTEIPEVDFVVGTYDKGDFAANINALFNDGHEKDLTHNGAYTFFTKHSQPDADKAFVPIMHGCNNYCAYCIVPYVRGREVSRAPLDILDEIKELDAAGVKEITLLGQNVNSYKYRQERNDILFPDLLRTIEQQLHNIRWVRFLTSHPKDVPDDLIKVLSESDKLCSHLHLPVQSGSDSVLKKMNRKYTRQYYLDLVRSMRNAVPHISLTTDIIVGFPGETEKEFEETLSLMRTVGFQDAFMYYYNDIEGTAASDMKEKIPQENKLERLQKVIELQRSISNEIKQKRIGQRAEVLIEDVSKKDKKQLLGRTAHDEMIVFPGDKNKIGQFSECEVVLVKGNTLIGEEII